MNFSQWQPVDDFVSLDRHEVHHGTIARQRERLAIQTSAGAWFYAVSFPCNYSAVPKTASHLFIRVNLLVSARGVGIGALHTDGNTFLAEQEFSPKDGPYVAELLITIDARCERIMVRNTALDSTASSTLVEDILTYFAISPAVRSSRAPRRGPFADQERLSRDQVGTIVDVGANIGNTVERYRQTFRNASVFAVEPAPDTFKKLVTRFANDHHVRSFQLACTRFRRHQVRCFN